MNSIFFLNFCNNVEVLIYTFFFNQFNTPLLIVEYM